MKTERMLELLSSLDGITYPEWQKVRFTIDRAFDLKRREADRSIHLPREDAIRIIRTELE